MRVSQRNFAPARVRLDLLVLLALVLVVVGIVLVALQLRPSVVLAKRQAALIDGIERRSPARIRRLVSEGYADRWGFDREDLVATMVDAGGQFLVLVITPEDGRWEIGKGRAVATMRLVVGGRSLSPVGQEVMRQANRIEEPFVFTWERQSFLPSSWRLVSVENAGLPDDLYGYEPGGFGRAIRDQ